MKRLLVVGAFALALLLPADHAFAAPSNSPNASVIPISCSGGAGTFDLMVVTNTGQSGSHGQGNPITLTPAFVLSGGSGKIVPTSGVFTFSGPGFMQTQSATHGNGPANGVPVTCTFSQSFSQGGQTYTFSGTVQGVWMAH